MAAFRGALFGALFSLLLVVGLALVGFVLVLAGIRVRMLPPALPLPDHHRPEWRPR